ncbi:hypothetical protein MKX03_011133, partial [Papaver bracteatum]
LFHFELCFLVVCEEDEEYFEKEAEQQDVDIENQYFNSKGLAETDLNEHWKDFLKWSPLN